MDPTLPTYLVETLDHAVARALWRQRLQGAISGLFAGIALLLAVFGIYAVISYAVAQRTREIGVRVALGATRRQVMALVLSHGAWLALIGIAAGVGGALALTRVLAGLLYEVRPTDPVTFIGVSVALGVVAVLAAAMPARRAATVDPLIAMRAE
jgi:putative ABC transport system permease protein